MRVVRVWFLVVFSLSSFAAVQAQKKYSVQKGTVHFVSNAELEMIKASCNSIRGLLDPATNQFAFTVEIKNFQGFNSQLQKEHFNEKYLESDKYPKASFTGKIIEPLDFAAHDTYEVRAKGDLDIHGVKQTRIIKVKIINNDGQLRVESRFTVPLADHNIAIPTIVNQKIATEIEVEFVATMVLP